MSVLAVNNSNNKSVALHNALRSAAMPQGPITLRKLRAVSIPIVSKAKQTHGRVGFVAGMITSLGMENMETFLKFLDGCTDRIAASQNYPVVSATKIVDLRIQRQLAQTETQMGWREHWRKFLADAAVTDLFLTPFYDLSAGALDERDAALRLGLRVHDVSQEDALMDLLRESGEAVRVISKYRVIRD